jgi:hypothetical protein
VITKYFATHNQIITVGGYNFGCTCVSLNLIIARISGSVSWAKHLLSSGTVKTINDKKLWSEILDSYSDDYEDFYPLGIPPCSPIEVHWSCEGRRYLHFQGRRINQRKTSKKRETDISQQMVAVRPSETSVNFYQTIRRYDPEDITLLTA